MARPFGLTWPARWLGAAAACAAATAAPAEEPKLSAGTNAIDTRFMTRQAGQDLPPQMQMPVLTTSPALMSARGDWPADEHGPLRAVAKDRDAVLTAGYESDGAVFTDAVALHQGLGPADVWVAARHDRQLPYKDGADVRVNAGYQRLNTQLAASDRPTDRSRVSLFAMRDYVSDLRLPNYGVDVPRFTRWTGTGIVDNQPIEGAFDKVEASATVSAVDYDCDNYSLRDQGALGVYMRGGWVAYRGQVRGEFTTGQFANAVTVDANLQRFDARVYNHFSSEGLSSYRMPKVVIARSGLTLTTAVDPLPGDRLSGGVRVDVAHSEATAAHEVPTVAGTGAAAYTVPPQQLWDTYYGARRNNPTDVTVSGKLRYEHDLDAAAKLYADASRLVRLPEVGERFYANGGPASMTQVGDPGLNPEAHHRIEFGGEQAFGGWKGHLTPDARAGSARLTAAGWYDRVTDFISADHARGQPGILKSDLAIVYRNVDAYLTGVTVAGWWQVAETVGARARLAWTEGGNLTDQRPLYQVPPVEGDVVVEHRRPLWDAGTGSVGVRLGFAGTQNRVDPSSQTGSGEDTGGRTPGFAVLDVYSGLVIDGRLGLSAGVANLLDKRYHTYLNPYPQSPTTLPQRAPGRSLFVMASLVF